MKYSGEPIQQGLSKIKKLLSTYYNNKIFSHSAVSFSIGVGDERIQCSFCFGDGLSHHDGNSCLFFDLASLTKPLVTLLSILCLKREGLVTWKSDLRDFYSLPGSKQPLFIKELLCHRSGLVSHRNYAPTLKTMENNKKKKWLLRTLLKEKQVSMEQRKAVYSDLGYMLLGLFVEDLSGLSLDLYWSSHVTGTLGLDNQLFFLPEIPSDQSCFVATGQDRVNHMLLQGIVHDDNCRALGGVAGHAGLFGTAEGVCNLGAEMLSIYHGRPSILPVNRCDFLTSVSRVDSADWSAGFSLPSKEGSSTGSFFSAQSFGHLGFTGTSFWIDPQRDLVVVLLTNRVIMGDDQKGIRELRPLIHDIVGYIWNSLKDGQFV